MSYTGNSKEAIVQLAGVDVVISNLQSDLTSEISNRVAQDGVLNARISTEKAVLEGKIDDEKNSRRAGDSSLNERLNWVRMVEGTRWVRGRGGDLGEGGGRGG